LQSLIKGESVTRTAHTFNYSTWHLTDNQMHKLNFPEFDFLVRFVGSRAEIYDPVRRKYIALTPEEWVRQHLIAYLSQTKGYSTVLFGVEKQITLNQLSKRFDLVLFNRDGTPLLLAECKAPSVEITEKVFDQAARYNLKLNAQYFLITNGLNHFYCRLDYEKRQYIFIEEIPSFSEL
jgi:hypothetical protein